MRYYRAIFFIFLLLPMTLLAHIEKNKAPLNEQILSLLAANKVSEANALIDKHLSTGSDTTIAHFWKAKIAINRKDWEAWHNYSAYLSGTSFFQNIGIVSEIFDGLPQKEQAWLIKLIEKDILGSMPLSGPCPFYELAERAQRAKFLWNVLKNHTLQKELAIKIFRELYIERPEAVNLEEFASNSIFLVWQKTLSIKDFLQRINNLMLFGKNTEAKETIEQARLILKNISKDDKNELRYQSAKLERKFRNYKKARAEFQEIAKVGNADQKLRARYMDLMLASMADDVSVAGQFDSFVVDYPTHGFSDDVLLFKAKMEKSTGNVDGMFKTLDILIKKYPNGDMIQEALFLKAFEQAKLGKLEDSLKSFSLLEKKSGHDSLSQHQAKYWQARLSIFNDIKELKGAKKDAIARAKKELSALIVSPSPTVYSWLALDLLKELKQSLPIIKKSAPLMPAKEKPIKDGELKLISKLIEVGFIKEALSLLNELPAPKNEDAVFATAKLYIDLERPELAYQKLIQCNAVAPRLLARQPSLYERIMLPRPFTVELNAATKHADVPHELIYGIMRRESCFLPHARSWAQARGLMQMMKPTADAQAKKIGIELKNDEDLYNPMINLMLGTTLIRDLWQKYGNWAVVLSDYNAGPPAARSWLKRNDRRPLDNYIESISYKETKEYVAVVLGGGFHYWREKGLKNIAPLDLNFAQKIAPKPLIHHNAARKTHLPKRHL